MGTEFRRCQPLLGTLVEIVVRSHATPELDAAVSAAFAAIADIHRLMSFQESESDVSRINQGLSGFAIKVDPRTYAVLAAAEEMRIATWRAPG